MEEVKGEQVLEEGVFFDLEDLNPGTWFSKDTGKGVIEVCLRLCAGDDYAEIQKKTTKNKIVYHKGQRIVYPEVDSDLDKELTYDFSIMDWKGIYADREKTIPLPCTKENKKLLMGKSVIFSRFVVDCLTKLAGIEEEEEDREEKNL